MEISRAPHQPQADPPPERWSSLLLGGAAMVATLVITTVALWFWREWDMETFEEWKREAGPVSFFAALALLPAIGFPTTPFYILAGATFSLPVNFIGIGISLAINLSICYLIAHSGLRRVITWSLQRTRYKLPALKPGQALRFSLLVKLTPGVATFLKNYIIAMAGVPFGLYFMVSFGITACYAAAFVLLGDSLVDRNPGMGVMATGILLLVIVAVMAVRRHLRAVPRESDDSR